MRARAVRSCCNQFIRLWLLVLNVIDGVAGVLLLVWGFVLHAKLMHHDGGDSEDYAFCWLPRALGAALTLAAALSFVGAAVQCCRCGLCLSAWLSIPIAFFELGVAVYTLAEEAKFFRMLRDHKAQLPVRVELLEDWQKPITAALFALALAEAARGALDDAAAAHQPERRRVRRAAARGRGVGRALRPRGAPARQARSTTTCARSTAPSTRETRIDYDDRTDGDRR